jgi:putative oxidoreductase
MNRYLPVLSSPGGRCFAPLALIRIAFGLFFFASGFNKVFVPENQALMLETMIEAGIPFPAFMAVFVAACETVFGLLLAIGLLTRLSALVLLCISTVALFTVGLHHIPPHINLLTWYSWLLYLPESGYILMAILLIVQGCGPWGVDRWIHQRLHQGDSAAPGVSQA